VNILQPIEVWPSHQLDILLQERTQSRVVRQQIDIIAITNVLADLLFPLSIQAVGGQEVINVGLFAHACILP
jgi:hypothetical protein